MAIYRGEGGAGDATADASNAAALADAFADAANASAGQAATSAAAAEAAKLAAEAAQTAAELAETNAETAEANAEAVLTDAGFIVVAADLQGTDTIGTVATDIANVNAVGNNIANVNTVAGISADVTAVAGDATDIGTVATNIANVNAVGSNIADVTAVADNETNIDAVAANNTNITTVAGISANVTTVAGISANVTTVATNDTNVTTVATNIANVNAVGTNIANVNSVAGNATNINAVNANKTNIDAVAGNNTNITAVAGNATNINAVNANATNINTVAGINANVTTVAGISGNVTTVATNSANVTTVAGSIANVNTNATNIANINQNAANIVAIQNASANATAAASSATAAAGSATSASASAAAASAVALGNEPVRHSVRPSLLLDFANTKTLDPRITFTRASTASFYDGKTVAKAEENLVTFSQEFDNAAWTKINLAVTANSTTAPDGTTTAETLTASSGTVSPYIIRTDAFTALVPTAGSFFAKAGTHSFIQIWVSSMASVFANFDLSAGTVGTFANCTTSITSVGNGWYRCSIFYTPDSTGGRQPLIAMVGSSSANRLQAFSAAGTETVFLWGAQLEQRSSVTAYTATTTAPITNYIPAMQTAASGVARFEHNPITGESLGLEIEEQRTNLVLRSDDFANASWIKNNSIAIGSNVIVAPDGTLTGDSANTPSSSAAPFTSQSVSGTTAQTFSLYAKAGTANFVYLDTTAAGNCFAVFNLSTGAVAGSAGCTASVTAVGNGWYRCVMANTTVATQFQIIGVREGYTSGNPLSNESGTGKGIYIWGAQLEAGAFATSYIPTVASQVTRSTDSASMTGTNFSSWYRADEGTLYAEAFSDSARAIVGLGQGSFNTNIFFNATNLVRYAAATPSLTLGTAVNGSVKLAAVLKPSDFAASANGAAVVTSTANVTVQFSANQLQIGAPTGSSVLNGTIKKLAYYPRRLTNAELVSLSTI
jgi:hypothetical protein